MPPPPPPPIQSLPDELLEEIFFRLPPNEPLCLVRASVANKRWLGILSCHAFRGRYRKFHGSPPMLGFLYSWPFEFLSRKAPSPRFISTMKFGADIPDNRGGNYKYPAWDCRHGRVLLRDNWAPTHLVVWDPMTGRQRKLKVPTSMGYVNGATALFCAASGCDHHACHAGPFQVVFLGLDMTDDDNCVAHARVSSPVTGDWSKSFSDVEWSDMCSSLQLAPDALIDSMPSILVENTLHFMLTHDDDDSVNILKYDLSSNCLSLIDAPLSGAIISGSTILMSMEDGSLGFAHVDKVTLNIWSRQLDANGIASWNMCRVVELMNLIPIQNPTKRLKLIGSMEGSDIIFITADLGIYEVNIKTLQWKKLWKREKFRYLIPYMSFYNPPEWLRPCDVAH
ncbi:unnamed protein product [Triticum turgidum subsp. durum]|uniref:F-box domain-containing protein n=1 Tax=Triticum turgidum subsp. durum TaxID=4567 RepID=A0A9R0XPH2_TRITD|nr:unnamed protein product [Triticum turgidum subsp. durum]